MAQLSLSPEERTELMQLLQPALPFLSAVMQALMRKPEPEPMPDVGQLLWERWYGEMVCHGMPAVDAAAKADDAHTQWKQRFGETPPTPLRPVGGCPANLAGDGDVIYCDLEEFHEGDHAGQSPIAMEVVSWNDDGLTGVAAGGAICAKPNCALFEGHAGDCSEELRTPRGI